MLLLMQMNELKYIINAVIFPESELIDQMQSKGSKQGNLE